MRKVAYVWIYRWVDKVNRVDVVEFKKNARLNYGFQYKCLDL